MALESAGEKSEGQATERTWACASEDGSSRIRKTIQMGWEVFVGASFSEILPEHVVVVDDQAARNREVVPQLKRIYGGRVQLLQKRAEQPAIRVTDATFVKPSHDRADTGCPIGCVSEASEPGIQGQLAGPRPIFGIFDNGEERGYGPSSWRHGAERCGDHFHAVLGGTASVRISQVGQEHRLHIGARQSRGGRRGPVGSIEPLRVASDTVEQDRLLIRIEAADVAVDENGYRVAFYEPSAERRCSRGEPRGETAKWGRRGTVQGAEQSEDPAGRCAPLDQTSQMPGREERGEVGVCGTEAAFFFHSEQPRSERRDEFLPASLTVAGDRHESVSGVPLGVAVPGGVGKEFHGRKPTGGFQK